jgi:hypothetical protein
LRRDLADELLVDRKLAVSEVAFLLGYSEPSAFQRAFRRSDSAQIIPDPCGSDVWGQSKNALIPY